MKSEEFPCPCCGYLTFDAPPGSDAICEICGWQDDISQLRFPLTGGGANGPSLVQAQKNFIELGYSNGRRLDTGGQRGDKAREPTWRMIDLTRDDVEFAAPGVDYGLTYPANLTVLYYWGVYYWRKR